MNSDRSEIIWIYWSWVTLCDWWNVKLQTKLHWKYAVLLRFGFVVESAQICVVHGAIPMKDLDVHNSKCCTITVRVLFEWWSQPAKLCALENVTLCPNQALTLNLVMMRTYIWSQVMERSKRKRLEPAASCRVSLSSASSCRSISAHGWRRNGGVNHTH